MEPKDTDRMDIQGRTLKPLPTKGLLHSTLVLRTAKFYSTHHVLR